MVERCSYGRLYGDCDCRNCTEWKKERNKPVTERDAQRKLDAAKHDKDLLENAIFWAIFAAVTGVIMCIASGIVAWIGVSYVPASLALPGGVVGFAGVVAIIISVVYGFDCEIWKKVYNAQADLDDVIARKVEEELNKK